MKDLSYSYDRKTEVLDGISFTARPGELTTIVGANGAGKTTTLKCIAGFTGMAERSFSMGRL